MSYNVKDNTEEILERAWRNMRAASKVDPAKGDIHLNGVRSGQFKRVVRQAIQEARRRDEADIR